jgi:hypothetical protein
VCVCVLRIHVFVVNSWLKAFIMIYKSGRPFFLVDFSLSVYFIFYFFETS